MDILSSCHTLKISFEKYSLISGVIYYHLRATTKDKKVNLSLLERYSSMREFYVGLKRRFPNRRLPPFPGRTLFRALTKANLLKRQLQLQHFFTQLLKNKEKIFH
jgi:hypothetical protein